MADALMKCYPQVVVEISFERRPTEAPLWVDVTEDVTAFATSRGRQTEWDRIQAGQATVTLRNTHRAYDPTYTDGPYYGQLKRMRRCRIRAAWNGIIYPIYSGYITRFPQSYATFDHAWVDLPLIDGLAVLALKRLVGASYPEERSDVRISRVLDDVHWLSPPEDAGWRLGQVGRSELGTTTVLGPVGDRNINAGHSTIVATNLDNVTALSHAQAVEEAENGQFFVAADGAATFYGRHRRILRVAEQAMFGDRPFDGPELPYVGVEVSDDTPLYNEVSFERPGGETITKTDETSVLEHFPQSRPKQTLLVTSDGEVGSAAAWWLNRHADPPLRLSALHLDGTGAPDRLWPVILRGEIGDRYLVRRRPEAGGNILEQSSFLEGIDHRYRAGGTWETTWHLSPADTHPYWRIGQSQLGVSTRLAY
jgi:hypothetical protein